MSRAWLFRVEYVYGRYLHPLPELPAYRENPLAGWNVFDRTIRTTQHCAVVHTSHAHSTFRFIGL